MTPESWADIHRVLAVRLDNIGDVVMLGPSLRGLKQARPHVEITLLTSPAGAQVAPLLPWVDDVIVHRAVWQELSSIDLPDPQRQLHLIQELQARAFDAAFIFTSFSQSPYPPAYACYLAGIPLRVGLSKEFGGALLTHEPESLPDETHQVDRNLSLLQASGFRPIDTRLSLTISSGVQKSADRLLLQAGIDARAPFVVMAPGASCAARRYDLRRAATVARQLPQQTGLPLVLVGSPREEELLRPLVAADEDGVFSLVGRTSVPQLAAVIRRAALLITNNSGPMHIADALRRPMVVLYSGTEYESQWRPRRAAATLLNRPVSCSPCYSFTCPYDMECLDVTPWQVTGEAIRMLKQHGRPQRAWREESHMAAT